MGESKNQSINGHQYGKVSPLSNEENTGVDHSNDSKSNLNIDYFTNGVPQPVKRNKAERAKMETEFKIRFYDHLLYQMDKQ